MVSLCPLVPPKNFCLFKLALPLLEYRYDILLMTSPFQFNLLSSFNSSSWAFFPNFSPLHLSSSFLRLSARVRWHSPQVCQSLVSVRKLTTSCSHFFQFLLFFPAPFSESILAFPFQIWAPGRDTCVVRSKGNPKQHIHFSREIMGYVNRQVPQCSELFFTCQDIKKFLSKVSGKKVLCGL